MNKNIFISDEELNNFGNTVNLSQKCEALLAHQKENWDLVKNNFQNLEKVQIREFNFEDYKIKVQFNPSRITSTSAKVDKKSIENRACFLCKENLPLNQKGINYKNKYVILINPFPIFKQHLTIPHVKHIPQSIENNFINDLLDLSYDLRDNFFVFYNGPQCGASAPDHLHFQAGLKKSTPIEIEYSSLVKNFGEEIIINNSSKIISINHKAAKLFLIESNKKQEIIISFNNILSELKEISNSETEPMVNVFSIYEDNFWKVFVYPRKKHRPKQYFLTGESKILISPAAADLAGLCITPEENTFKKVTKIELEDICNQVIIDGEKQKQIFDNLKKNEL